MQPEYDLGDILIKRVANGWMVIQASVMKEDGTDIFVYEDNESANYTAESLCNLITEQFEAYLQSKKKPGIKISFSHKTKEEENEH